MELAPPPPSVLPDSQASWGGSVTGWAPPTPPLPSRDKDMSQISNQLFMFLLRLHLTVRIYIFL